MYTKVVIERFKNPKNAGGMHGASTIGQVGSAACGEIMKLYLQIDEKETITNAKFKTFGCCASIASSDVVCDLVKNKTIEQALQVTNNDILDILGELPPHKMHCCIMAEEVVKSAIEEFYKKKEKLAKAEIKKAQAENQE